MKKNIFNLIAIGVMVFFLGTCSESTNSKTNQRPPEKGDRPQLTQLIAEMDANKDGKLAKAEVKGPLANDFDKIDADKDGFLTEAELQKMEASPPPRRN